MSNLGFHTIYHRVSEFHGVRCIRVFYERKGDILSPEFFDPFKKGIFLSTGVNLKDFDAIFFSVSYEIDYLNLVRMLSESGFSPLSRNRQKDDPPVIIGGIVPSSNPEIAGAFADIVYRGELTGNGFAVLELLFKYRFRKTSELYDELSKISGVYIQGVTSKIPPPVLNEVIKVPAHSVIVTPDTQFSNMFLIEIARGCKSSCTFCLARYMAWRYREVSLDSILEILDVIPEGVKKVGLIAPLVSDHSGIFDLVDMINRMDYLVSFSSLRADDFSEEFAKLLNKNGQKTVTFAPETGTNRLRSMIGKSLKNDSILKSVEIAFKNRIKKIRLYFMYGLPGEKQEDIDSIVSMAEEISSIAKGYRGEVFLSINQFVPKKLTPLETVKLHPLVYYEEVRSYLNDRLSGLGNTSFKFESLRGFPIQYFISVGDKKYAEILVDSAEKGSFKIFRELYRERFGG